MASDATTLDLGVGNVHVPTASAGEEDKRTGTTTLGNAFPDGPPKESTSRSPEERRAARAAKKLEEKKARDARRAAKGGKNGRARVPQSIHIRADIAPGGAIHVRHNLSLAGWGETQLLSIKPEDLGTDEAPKPVWIQLAKPGSFRGHPSGKAFVLNRTVFEQIVANFRGNKDGRLPIDFEHASEQDAAEGSIPVSGAPARGWIVDMKLGDDGNLYAKVEWGALARQYIREGAYRYISPAIHLRMKDRETGLEIGAYVSSAGLTNQPFLDGMRPLAARRDGGQARAGDGGATPSAVMLAKPFLTQTLRAPSDYMPVIRACLGLTELSTHDEVCAQMTRLSERCALADATGKHEGVDLRSTYLNGLAECAGVSGGATMQDILDTVQDMIDVAIDQHVDSYHEGGSANLSAKQPSDTTTTTTITPEEEHMEPKPADLTAKITSLESEVTTLSGHVSTKDKELVTLRTTHEVLTKAHEEAMTLCKAAGIKAEGTVVDLVKNLLETNAVLLKAKTDRDEADILADVALVIEQYGPAGLKHFGEDRKPALLKHRRESPESFKDSYPIMTREQLTDAVRLLTNSPQGNPPKRAMPTPKSDKVVLSHAALTAKLMTEKSLSYRDAQDEASRQLKAMEDGAVHGAAK